MTIIVQLFRANIKFLECQPVDILLTWSNATFFFVTQSYTYSSERDQVPNELKPHSPQVNKTSTQPPLAQLSKGTPHTLNHTAPSPLFHQTGLGGTQAWSFWMQLLPVKSPHARLPYHQKYYFLYLRNFTSFLLYTSLWPRIPCTSSPPTPHIPVPPVRCTFESLWWGFFCGSSLHARAVGCFRRGVLIFDGVLNATLSEEKVSTIGVTQGNLELLLPPWFTPNTITIRWNLGLTSRPHFLEGELIRLVDKAKNAWLIVRQLPIKAGWWDDPLALWDFRRRSKHIVYQPISTILIFLMWLLILSWIFTTFSAGEARLGTKLSAHL